jgi:hypothetical protein
MTEVARYRSDEGSFPILIVKEGRSLLHYIRMDASGIKIRTMAKAERKHLSEMTYHGKAYKASKAASHLRKAGARLGITKTAQRALRGI